MSGAEFIAVAGVVSSIIAIVDGIKQVVDAASEVEGLPKAFRQASNKLPLVSDILEATKHSFETDNVSGVEKSVTLVIDDCEDKWKTLNGLFDKVIPDETASRLERYHSAVKTLGRGGKVESLMKGMLEDILLLVTIKTMTTTNVEKVIKTVTTVQEEKVTKAISDVATWPPSVPDDIFQDGTYTNINYGTGQYIAQAGAEQNNFEGNARQYHSGGGSQTINEDDAEKDEAEACLAALFLTYPRDDREGLIQTKGSRVDGTCEWIKTNELYNSWLQSHSQLLWISGGPGKGKTMLSIFLATELEQMAKESSGISFLQYFCDNKDEKRNTAVAIVRGLIFQLLELHPKLISHILPSFKIQNKSLFTSSSFETLWRIFESMIRDPILGTTYCVLDGLDECDPASLEVLLGKFATLLSTKSSSFSACHLNLIVVSRDFPDFIPHILSSFPRIRLDPDAETEVNDDIQRFIQIKVDDLSRYKEYPQPLRIHVEEVFRTRAQGTFLWIGIVAKELMKYKTTEVEEALNLFPSGLEGLYARMLLQIDENRRETAATILRWIVMAVRPLTLTELSIAIETTTATEPTTVKFSRDEIMRDQLSYCGYFITIKTDEVGLIHQSAKDYLLRKTEDSNPSLEFFRVKEYSGNLQIANKCFNYLQSGALINGAHIWNIAVGLKAFPLLSYATLHWHVHARSLAYSEAIFDLSHPFYQETSGILECWVRVYGAIEQYRDTPTKQYRHQKPAHVFTPLHFASYFGIVPLAENILLKKRWKNKLGRLHIVNKKNRDGQTPLHEAAIGGHESIVKLLLEKGADAEAKDGNGQTALYEAAEGGHEAVVQLLLEKGADAKAKDEDGWTLLHRAAWGGNEAVVQLLLEKGADAKAKDEDGVSVLHGAASGGYGAAESGHEAMVQLLLEKGADAKAKNKYGRTVLHDATGDGNEAIVQLLLDKGADAKAKDKDGQTVLHQAAWNGNEAIVQLLLDKGADAKAKDKDRQTVLHEAVQGGRAAIVKLLLEKGADAKAKDKHGWTVLHMPRNMDKATVQLLIQKGVDVKARDRKGRTVLHKARGMDKAAVQLLIENGVDVKARDSKGRTVLHEAWTMDKAAVQLLIEKGVDVNARDSDGQTALHQAWKMDKAIVQLLLEMGADSKAKNSEGRTALDICRYNDFRDNRSIVQLLTPPGPGT
ncbi:hypothetical protein V494_08258 [Pseudogymnoascus sp. VKM F-4513 (FW-928)]|nr:hypothetical protein V494_08258 [Pseudogymnoascus sp. VKM F-4513 (FW-928)]